MSLETYHPEKSAAILDADVLVLGGGPAATWAALSAAAHGARVVLADKGYCGTSGATAPSNTGTWYLPSGAQREAEAERRLARAEGLADRRWLLRVMDQAHQRLDELAEGGYPFPFDEDGKPYRANLRGPDYMRFMRRRVLQAGVKILDHSPALELLWSGGIVAGASGQNSRTGAGYEVRAGAVILATGGCAFLSRALGTDGNTGDGYLMAAEAGARLSGMEFSAQYGLSPSHSSVTKGLTFAFSSFYLDDGSKLPETGEDRAVRIARAIIQGRKVYALMDRGTAEGHDHLKRGQPNCFLPLDRIGLDPFKEQFEVTLRSEGTVRGCGGLEIINDDCATSVPGLFAAGDAASRENLVGAASGGGSPNSSWAIASGTWSGRAATLFARQLGPHTASRPIRALGGAGLRPQGNDSIVDDAHEIVVAIKAENLPLDVNFFRSQPRIAMSQQRLENIWRELRTRFRGTGRNAVKVREAASMAATARWIWASAGTRNESRGLHRRLDRPELDGNQARRIAVGGLDTVWTEVDQRDLRAIAS